MPGNVAVFWKTSGGDYEGATPSNGSLIHQDEADVAIQVRAVFSNMDSPLTNSSFGYPEYYPWIGTSGTGTQESPQAWVMESLSEGATSYPGDIGDGIYFEFKWLRNGQLLGRSFIRKQGSLGGNVQDIDTSLATLFPSDYNLGTVGSTHQIEVRVVEIVGGATYFGSGSQLDDGMANFWETFTFQTDVASDAAAVPMDLIWVQNDPSWDMPSTSAAIQGDTPHSDIKLYAKVENLKSEFQTTWLGGTQGSTSGAVLPQPYVVDVPGRPVSPLSIDSNNVIVPVGTNLEEGAVSPTAQPGIYLEFTWWFQPPGGTIHMRHKSWISPLVSEIPDEFKQPGPLGVHTFLSAIELKTTLGQVFPQANNVFEEGTFWIGFRPVAVQDNSTISYNSSAHPLHPHELMQHRYIGWVINPVADAGDGGEDGGSTGGALVGGGGTGEIVIDAGSDNDAAAGTFTAFEAQRDPSGGTSGAPGPSLNIRWTHQIDAGETATPTAYAIIIKSSDYVDDAGHITTSYSDTTLNTLYDEVKSTLGGSFDSPYAVAWLHDNLKVIFTSGGYIENGSLDVPFSWISDQGQAIYLNSISTGDGEGPDPYGSMVLGIYAFRTSVGPSKAYIVPKTSVQWEGTASLAWSKVDISKNDASPTGQSLEEILNFENVSCELVEPHAFNRRAGKTKVEILSKLDRIKNNRDLITNEQLSIAGGKHLLDAQGAPTEEYFPNDAQGNRSYKLFVDNITDIANRHALYFENSPAYRSSISWGHWAKTATDETQTDLAGSRESYTVGEGMSEVSYKLEKVSGKVDDSYAGSNTDGPKYLEGLFSNPSSEEGSATHLSSLYCGDPAHVTIDCVGMELGGRSIPCPDIGDDDTPGVIATYANEEPAVNITFRIHVPQDARGLSAKTPDNLDHWAVLYKIIPKTSVSWTNATSAQTPATPTDDIREDLLYNFAAKVLYPEDIPPGGFTQGSTSAPGYIVASIGGAPQWDTQLFPDNADGPSIHSPYGDSVTYTIDKPVDLYNDLTARYTKWEGDVYDDGIKGRINALGQPTLDLHSGQIVGDSTDAVNNREFILACVLVDISDPSAPTPWKEPGTNKYSPAYFTEFSLDSPSVTGIDIEPTPLPTSPMVYDTSSGTTNTTIENQAWPVDASANWGVEAFTSYAWGTPGIDGSWGGDQPPATAVKIQSDVTPVTWQLGVPSGASGEFVFGNADGDGDGAPIAVLSAAGSGPSANSTVAINDEFDLGSFMIKADDGDGNIDTIRVDLQDRIVQVDWATDPSDEADKWLTAGYSTDTAVELADDQGDENTKILFKKSPYASVAPQRLNFSGNISSKIEAWLSEASPHSAVYNNEINMSAYYNGSTGTDYDFDFPVEWQKIEDGNSETIIQPRFKRQSHVANGIDWQLGGKVALVNAESQNLITNVNSIASTAGGQSATPVFVHYAAMMAYWVKDNESTSGSGVSPILAFPPTHTGNIRAEWGAAIYDNIADQFWTTKQETDYFPVYVKRSIADIQARYTINGQNAWASGGGVFANGGTQGISTNFNNVVSPTNQTVVIDAYNLYGNAASQAADLSAWTNNEQFDWSVTVYGGDGVTIDNSATDSIDGHTLNGHSHTGPSLTINYTDADPDRTIVITATHSTYDASQIGTASLTTTIQITQICEMDEWKNFNAFGPNDSGTTGALIYHAGGNLTSDASGVDGQTLISTQNANLFADIIPENRQILEGFGIDVSSLDLSVTTVLGSNTLALDIADPIIIHKNTDPSSSWNPGALETYGASYIGDTTGEWGGATSVTTQWESVTGISHSPAPAIDIAAINTILNNWVIVDQASSGTGTGEVGYHGGAFKVDAAAFAAATPSDAAVLCMPDYGDYATFHGTMTVTKSICGADYSDTVPIKITIHNYICPNYGLYSEFSLKGNTAIANSGRTSRIALFRGDQASATVSLVNLLGADWTGQIRVCRLAVCGDIDGSSDEAINTMQVGGHLLIDTSESGTLGPIDSTDTRGLNGNNHTWQDGATPKGLDVVNLNNPEDYTTVWDVGLDNGELVNVVNGEVQITNVEQEGGIGNFYNDQGVYVGGGGVLAFGIELEFDLTLAAVDGDDLYPRGLVLDAVVGEKMAPQNKLKLWDHYPAHSETVVYGPYKHSIDDWEEGFHLEKQTSTKSRFRIDLSQYVGRWWQLGDDLLPEVKLVRVDWGGDLDQASEDLEVWVGGYKITGNNDFDIPLPATNPVTERTGTQMIGGGPGSGQGINVVNGIVIVDIKADTSVDSYNMQSFGTQGISYGLEFYFEVRGIPLIKDGTTGIKIENENTFSAEISKFHETGLDDSGNAIENPGVDLGIGNADCTITWIDQYQWDAWEPANDTGTPKIEWLATNGDSGFSQNISRPAQSFSFSRNIGISSKADWELNRQLTMTMICNTRGDLAQLSDGGDMFEPGTGTEKMFQVFNVDGQVENIDKLSTVDGWSNRMWWLSGGQPQTVHSSPPPGFDMSVITSMLTYDEQNKITVTVPTFAGTTLEKNTAARTFFTKLGIPEYGNWGRYYGAVQVSKHVCDVDLLASPPANHEAAVPMYIDIFNKHCYSEEYWINPDLHDADEFYQTNDGTTNEGESVSNKWYENFGLDNYAVPWEAGDTNSSHSIGTGTPVNASNNFDDGPYTYFSISGNDSHHRRAQGIMMAVCVNSDGSGWDVTALPGNWSSPSSWTGDGVTELAQGPERVEAPVFAHNRGINTGFQDGGTPNPSGNAPGEWVCISNILEADDEYGWPGAEVSFEAAYFEGTSTANPDDIIIAGTNGETFTDQLYVDPVDGMIKLNNLDKIRNSTNIPDNGQYGYRFYIIVKVPFCNAGVHTYKQNLTIYTHDCGIECCAGDVGDVLNQDTGFPMLASGNDWPHGSTLIVDALTVARALQISISANPDDQDETRVNYWGEPTNPVPLLIPGRGFLGTTPENHSLNDHGDYDGCTNPVEVASAVNMLQNAGGIKHHHVMGWINAPGTYDNLDGACTYSSTTLEQDIDDGWRFTPNLGGVFEEYYDESTGSTNKPYDHAYAMIGTDNGLEYTADMRGDEHENLAIKVARQYYPETGVWDGYMVQGAPSCGDTTQYLPSNEYDWYTFWHWSGANAAQARELEFHSWSAFVKASTLTQIWCLVPHFETNEAPQGSSDNVYGGGACGEPVSYEIRIPENRHLIQANDSLGFLGQDAVYGKIFNGLHIDAELFRKNVFKPIVANDTCNDIKTEFDAIGVSYTDYGKSLDPIDGDVFNCGCCFEFDKHLVDNGTYCLNGQTYTFTSSQWQVYMPDVQPVIPGQPGGGNDSGGGGLLNPNTGDSIDMGDLLIGDTGGGTAFDNFGGGGGLPNFNFNFPCFTADTKIQTDGGLEDIIDIKIDDLVWTWNFEKQVAELHPVKKIVTREADTDLASLTFSGVKDSIKATPDHPFWVEKKGWCCIDPSVWGDNDWIGLDKLKIGDICFVVDVHTRKLEEVKLVDVQKSAPEKTYTIVTVAGNYFAEGVLVHEEIKPENS